YVTRWRIRSDLYHWVPGGSWRRTTRGARLVAPAGGGGRFAAVALGPAAGTPTIPVPPGPPGAVWDDIALSPDGRWVAGRGRAGRLSHAAAVRCRARGDGARNGLHVVAVAASAFLDSRVRRRGTDGAVLWRLHGGNGCGGSLRVWRRRVRRRATVPGRGRFRAGLHRAGQPDSRPLDLGLMGRPAPARGRVGRHALRAGRVRGGRRVVRGASLAHSGEP